MEHPAAHDFTSSRLCCGGVANIQIIIYLANYFSTFLGDGVVAGATEGVAAQDALEGEPAAAEWAVFADGFLGILRAGGGEAAGRRRQRRNAGAVECYQRQHQFGKEKRYE